jgi:hypothetical protein
MLEKIEYMNEFHFSLAAMDQLKIGWSYLFLDSCGILKICYILHIIEAWFDNI